MNGLKEHFQTKSLLDSEKYFKFKFSSIFKSFTLDVKIIACSRQISLTNRGAPKSIITVEIGCIVIKSV